MLFYTDIKIQYLKTESIYDLLHKRKHNYTNDNRDATYPPIHVHTCQVQYDIVIQNKSLLQQCK